MKFECEKKELLGAIEKVILATSPKPTIPYLSNIYFAAENNSLVLNTLDMEIFMKTVLPVKVLEKGKMVVNAKKFHDIIKVGPDGVIKLAADEKKLHLSSPRTEYDIIMPVINEEAPEFKEVGQEKKVTVPADTLKAMIRKTIFAISTDSLRYVLNGVYIIVEKDVIKLITTDGKRLSYISKPSTGAKKLTATAIIPSKAVNILSSLISTQSVDILFGTNQVQFMFDSTILISRLVDGNYPNYEQVIPKDSDTKIVFDTKAFMEAVNRVSVLADDKTTPIKVTFGKGKITFFEQDSNGNCSTEEMETKYDGKEFVVSYNPYYLIDVLKNIDAAETCFLLTSALNPAVLRPQSDEEYINVIMPMRI